MRLVTGILVGIVCCLLGACLHPTRVYHRSETVHIDGWSAGDTLSFALDSLSQDRYMMNVEVRYTVDYPYQDLWLVVQHNLVDSSHWMIDTLHCQLIDERGIVQGVGFSGIYQLQVPCKKIEVQEGGSSPMVRLNHCMNGLLKGISDIGISLERVESD